LGAREDARTQFCLALIYTNEGVVCSQDYLVQFLEFALAQRLVVDELALHVVGPEVSTRHHTLLADQVSLALAPVVRPLAIVYFLRCIDELAATAVSLAVNVLTIINVAGRCVLVDTLAVSALVSPATLVLRPIQVDYFAFSLLDERDVLSEVDVAARVEQFAH